MARLWSCGFESQSIVNGVEVEAWIGSASFVQIDTTNVRSGLASLKITAQNNASEYGAHTVSSSDTVLFARAYIYFTGLPTTNATVIQLQNFASTNTACLALNSTGGMSLFEGNSAGTKIGASSNNLLPGNWYMVDVTVNNGATNKMTARVNGNIFAQGGSAANLASAKIAFGAPDFVSGHIIWFDDIAVNDNTGSFQNSYPGPGSIVHLLPAAAGDNNGFTTQVGGTAGAANNFTRVDEIIPNDATDYNGDKVTNNADDFDLAATPASIKPSDTISVVQVGVRYSALVAAAESAMKVRVKSASGGTLSKSAAITPTSTSWVTNANAAPILQPLTLYQDPDSNNWTKATLDTAQVGYEISTGNTNITAISTIWLLVDSFTPGASHFEEYGRHLTVGNGESRNEVSY